MKSAYKTKWLFVAAMSWLCGCTPKGPANADRFCLLIEDKTGSNIKTYDFLSLNYSLKTQDGKVLYTTGNFDQRPKLQFAGNPLFKGDLNTALTQLSEGDSAIIRVNLDSMIRRMHIAKPATRGKYLIYNVRVNKVLTRGALSDSELNKVIETMRQRETEKARVTEPEKIRKYVLLKHIKPLSLPSGLLAVTTAGTQYTSKNGNIVLVKYQISTLDGAVLETNDSALARQARIFHPRFNYQPYPVKANLKSSHWFEQAASILSAGKVAHFIVPSKLAYGKYGTKKIEPYTPLLCQMQLVTLKKIPIK